MEEIAPGIAVVPMKMANAYLVGDAQSWVLVDSGTPGNHETIKEAAEERFGPGAKPRAIVLTHGHFDHAASSPELAEMWNVDVYVHKLEMPFLTGMSSYPPMDVTAPGAFSFMARFFPSGSVDLGTRIVEWNGDFAPFGISGWQSIDTPGHTPGHFAFFRPEDRIVLAGDALSTMDLDTFTGILTKRLTLQPPPAPATYNWPQAHESVQRLADLKPSIVAAGHGKPFRNAANPMKELAANFKVPEHGRYVPESALFDDHGITYLPPKPPDRLVRATVGVGAAAVAIGIGGALVYKRRKP